MNAFNLADVERVFGNIKPVRYQQELEFRCDAPLPRVLVVLAWFHALPTLCHAIRGVKISAFRAGRTIGGSIWRVHKLLVGLLHVVGALLLGNGSRFAGRNRVRS
jgi:Cft2 family RNA processing exonuclease